MQSRKFKSGFILACAVWTFGCRSQIVNAGNTCESPPCEQTTQDPVVPGTTPRATSCRLQVPSLSVDFGVVEPGNSKSVNFELQNIGSADCEVSQLTFDTPNAGFQITNPPGLPLTLAPLARTTLALAFQNGAAPSPAPVARTGTLRVKSNDPTNPEIAVSLRARFGESCLLVTETLDFGDVTQGCNSREKTVSIINLCDAAVFIDSLNTSGPFSLPTLTFPQEIAPGDDLAVSVKFLANANGNTTSTLRVSYRDGSGSATQDVNLLGRMVTAADISESIELPSATDVLMVIDDSGSMAEEQGLLASKSADLFAAASALNLDLRVGVVTTDVDTPARGKLISRLGIKVVKNSSPTAVSALKTLIQNVGLDGSSMERPLDAAQLALSNGLLSAGNDELIRGNSNLVIFFLTDEEDASTYDVYQYRKIFQARYGGQNGNLLSFSGVVGKSTNPNCFADVASRVNSLVSLFGDETSDICDASAWTSFPNLTGERKRIYLRGVPSGSISQLQVNGQPVPATDYVVDLGGIDQGDSSSLSPAYVQLKQGTFKPGDTVTVTYTPACFQ